MLVSRAQHAQLEVRIITFMDISICEFLSIILFFKNSADWKIFKDAYEVDRFRCKIRLDRFRCKTGLERRRYISTCTLSEQCSRNVNQQPLGLL